MPEKKPCKPSHARLFGNICGKKPYKKKKGEAVHIKDPIYIPYQTEERKMRKMNAYELPKT
jgi:hypothetical protein